MGRALAIVFLAMGVAGFGLCALCSGAYGLSMKGGEGLVVLSLLMFGLTALCIWGIRVINRSARAADAAKAATQAEANKLPPPGA